MERFSPGDSEFDERTFLDCGLNIVYYERKGIVDLNLLSRLESLCHGGPAREWWSILTNLYNVVILAMMRR